MQVWILHHQSEPSKGKLPLPGNAPGQAAKGWEQPSPSLTLKLISCVMNFETEQISAVPWGESGICSCGAGVRVLSHSWWGWLPWELPLVPGTESRAGFCSDSSAAFAVLGLEMWQLCSLKPRVAPRSLGVVETIWFTESSHLFWGRRTSGKSCF